MILWMIELIRIGSVRIGSVRNFRWLKRWYVVAKLYFWIGFWALVYFNYTFIENPDIPSKQNRGDLLPCQKKKDHVNFVWHSPSREAVCFKDECPWSHQNGTKEHGWAWEGKWSKTEGQSFGRGWWWGQISIPSNILSLAVSPALDVVYGGGK